MTNKTYIFEQKRIDNVEWTGVSGLSKLPSLPNDGKSPALKTPLFYLTSVSIDNYQDDIYFVNNSEQTLHFVAPFKLYQNLDDAGVTLNDISENNVHKAKLYADNMDRLYKDVLPHQGVRIGSTHIIYDSDGLMQWFIQTSFRGTAHSNEQYGIWRFNVVEKGGVNKSYPLLWDDFSKPAHIVSCDSVSEHDEMPIEPSVYAERCWVFDHLIEALGIADALFVLAINDVLYRYCVGWSAPYNESDIQAKEIAHQCQKLKPKDRDAVKDIVQAVYMFWFDESFAKNVSMPACAEILDLYQVQLNKP